MTPGWGAHASGSLDAVNASVRVATLNCRNAVDGWPKRRRLLMDQLIELNPHVIGLQELRHFLPAQASWIAREVGRRTGQAYWLHDTYKTGLWWLWEGIAILSQLPILERDSLGLDGDNRVANFARLRLPAGGLLDVYNTHLAARGAEVRRAQVEAILAWMTRRPGTAQILLGDFNAAPSAASIRFACQTLRSAYAEANGSEPERTVPTPLRRVADWSRGVVLDYIFVNDAVEVRDARVTFDRPAAGDVRLYASDHFGLAATVSVR